MPDFKITGTVSDFRGYLLPHNLRVTLSGLTADGEFDINALAIKVDPDEAVDFLPIYSVADADNRKITIGSINHDELLGFVANEHIDHSTVSILAGTGLSGGGDLTADRTLSVNPAGIDHGLLSGLADDDHPQYPLAGSTETISGTWTFSATTITFNNDIKVNDQLFLGNPVDTTPKRYSSLYDAGSSRTNTNTLTERLEIDSDYDGQSGAATFRAFDTLVDLTGSGVLAGPSTLTALGHIVTINEDASGGAVDGHIRVAYRASFNHTNATSGNRIAYESGGGKFVARASLGGSTLWQIDPVPAANESVTQILATMSLGDSTSVPGTGTLTRPSTTVVRLNPTGAITIRGITNGGGGALHCLINISANNITVNNEDAAATAGDRIHTTDGGNPVVTPDGAIWLWYDGTTQRWRDIVRLL